MPASLRRLRDHFPRRFDQRTSDKDIGSGRRSSVHYTPNSRFHPSGQKSPDVFNIDDARYSEELITYVRQARIMRNNDYLNFIYPRLD
ncbi:hypothetical protein CVT25_014366 [Psilocybe cyanescens]|uniref:Uncharacterized protein n=1 Tax=Psilocybe cyanescens TaxID=93625 RepID=A0A409XPJ9_PSICY|nr:hypothetical protein CVT25_014366 [Psilocybe cyanescens]